VQVSRGVRRIACLVAALSTWLPISATAQPVADPGSRDWRPAVNLGVTFADITTDYRESAPLPGAAAGVALTPPLGFGLTVELWYVEQGGRGRAVLGEAPARADLTLRYLELAVLADLWVGQPLQRDLAVLQSTFTPYFFTGSYSAVLLDAAAEVSIEGPQRALVLGEEIAPLDFGWLIGGGVRFPLGGVEAKLEARSVFGLTDISPDREVVHTGSMTVVLGARF
jgi:hypothetical protein